MNRRAYWWLLPLSLIACDALFRPLRGNNPENCLVHGGLCGAGQVCDAVLERCVSSNASDMGLCPPSCPQGQACNSQKGICESLLTFDVTSVTPRSVPVGTSPQVTLRGIGFEPGMQVSFRGVLATNVNVMAQDLATVQVPVSAQAGTARVEISKNGMPLAKDNLFGYAWPTVSFAADTLLPTDMQIPGALVVADLNNDQKLDVATVHGTRASTFLGLSMGSTAKMSVDVSPLSSNGQLFSGQLNGDGVLDVLYFDRTGGRALSLLNNGNGTLTNAPPILNVPTPTPGAALADA